MRSASFTLTAGQTYDIVASLNAGIVNITTADAKSYGEDNLLEPVIMDTHFTTEDYYVLSGNEFRVIDVTQDTEVPAGKAVLKKPAGAAATRSLEIDDSGITTGVKDNNRETITNNRDDQWYGIQGQRIDGPTRKGLYILNGRKVVVR